MTIDPDDAPEDGERLILETEAREAGSAAFNAAVKHRSMLVSEFLVAAFVLTFAVFGGPASTLFAVAVIGLFEFLRRRAWSAAERAAALADELAAVADASDRPPGHPTT